MMIKFYIPSQIVNRESEICSYRRSQVWGGREQMGEDDAQSWCRFSVSENYYCLLYICFSY